MPDKKLRPKYIVRKFNDDGTMGIPQKSVDTDDVNSPFVLMPRKDPAAFKALLFYMTICEPSLANEIRPWLHKIAESEPVYGTQGLRNRKFSLLRIINEAE